MKESTIVAGLDIGTTKICAIVGRRNEHGKIEVLGFGKADSPGVMRGVISNIDKTVQAIREAMGEALRRAGTDVRYVYAGIAGQHIKSLQHRAYLMRTDSKAEINQSDVEKLVEDMQKISLPPGDRVIHVLPQEFIVDNEQGIKDPIGMCGTRLEADFHIITGQETATQNISRCIEKADYNIAELILEPIASASAVLNDEEKEAGVALVDIGGGTTDIAIFQDGIIRHTAVIPLGGNIITEDIKEGCMVMRDQAEKLKVKFGCALAGTAQENAIVSIPGLRGRSAKEISLRNLAHIIQARMEEILEHVYYEIRRSGFENKLIAGLVITGGGARLQHLKELAEYVTGLDTRIGFPTEHLTSSRLPALDDPLFATGIGLVLEALNRPEPVIMEEPAAEEFDDEQSGETEETNENAQVTADANNGGWFDNLLRKSKEWLEGDVGEFHN